ncbi:TetR/AcrR family transcriptional regulator [Marmoricola sp. RAF53]|uniref:TetR/AcrR family transcriptional regulator n=1 Tax=Marmoricola sp. RAF53 TaxID=3233059 RepID=UPI003F9D9834
MARTQEAERAGIKRRATIVNVALDLFAAHGYDATSLASVARAAGISQPGLLHHFHSKEVLLVAVLDERDQRALTAVDIDRAYDTTPVERALEVADAMVAWNAQHRELVRLGHLGAAHNPPLANAWARERTARFRAQLAGVIANDIAAGIVRPSADPGQVSSWVLAGIAGLESQWLIDEDFDMVASMCAFTQMLRRDLLVVS